MTDEREIRRTNLATDFYTDLTLTEAMDELEQAGKHRGHCLAALCEGDTVKTDTHVYRMLP